MDKLGGGKAGTRTKTPKVVVLVVMPCLTSPKEKDPPHTVLTNQSAWNLQVFVWGL